ncbi:MAG: PH domain-containing protein, partial [Catenulispora sp.]|nr:PH domain-containing protein [Catenulispora sp.]
MTDLPRRRLHPLSPFLHSARQLVAVVAVVSWQGYSQLGLERFAIGVVVVLLGAVAISVVAWRYTGYEITGRELRIHEGTFSRRTRAIPLERLQSVEVVRPLLAQLTGLAELRLEVVGGGKAEAPLAYLTVAEAQGLREHLLELAGGTAPATEEPVAEQVLYATRDDELLVSQSLSPEVIFLPIGVALIVLQFVTNGSFGFVAVASTVTALISAILRPVRRVTRDWRCRLTIADDRLHIRRGLTETRSQVVPVQRVQAVT